MRMYKAPEKYNVDDKFSIFLGGSIEQGKANDWQKKLANDLSVYSDSLVLLNPRRDHWDSNLEQDPEPGSVFHEQVEWELDALERDTDMVVFYFDPNTKSPVTLLELGWIGSADSFNTIVCCPPDFYRYGNVRMFCERFHVTLTEEYGDMLMWIRDRLDDRSVY